MEMFSYTYTHDCGIVLECTLEYEPAETGSTENGLKMEPDYPSVATLTVAKLNDADIFPLLGFDLIDEIEDLAKQAHESQEIDV
jgi:hypothetical protein